MKTPIIRILALLFLCSSAARGSTIMYTATLTGSAEAPPNASPATGTATVTFDDSAFTLRVQITFSGLLGTTTAAHIHAPTAVAGTGTVGIATQTPTFFGFPVGVTSGSYDNTFDLNSISTYNAAFLNASGGTAAGAADRLISALNDGKAYLNIHTSVVPSGEIRGFLARASVPEATATAPLLAASLLAMGFMVRRLRIRGA
jgi:hypothetical protein